MYEIAAIVEFFARGGGGGSGGGGGGGGEALALIGYFPSYYLGKLVKKLLPRKAELVVSGIFATLSSTLIMLTGVFSGSFAVGYICTCIAIGIWAGWAAAFFGAWERVKKQAKKTKKLLTAAAASDAAWNEAQLIEHARKVFLQYQADWSNMNAQNIATYATPRFTQDSALQLAALQQMYRQNTLSNTVIQGADIIDIHDDSSNNNDSFTIAFNASMTDQLIDMRTQQPLFTDNLAFIEYWTFRRHDNTWLLESINQSTENRLSTFSSLAQFAAENNFMYRLDMGWLFLPAGGSLMARGAFGKSDVNNYCAGMWGQQLVQLYTYIPVPAEDSSANFLIAQLTVPKSYSGIIVRPKSSLLSKAFGTNHLPKDYEKYQLEWPDFNNRYEVYALRQDSLATFELLNPGFMAYLYDTDPNVTLEVADNVIYLYKQTKNVSASDYQTMMTLLQKAHKELQL